MATSEDLRLIPKVDTLVSDPAFAALVREHGQALVTEAVRVDLAALRSGIACSTFEDEVRPYVLPERCAERAAERLAAQAAPVHGRALNATGVILHTGLGRAPLCDAARAALERASRFAIVEVDRQDGRRGLRDSAIGALLRELTGCEGATVVNNNAGATLIALAALAAGRPVIVSRGQLVEIGGSYRIPDVMAQSGCKLVEVGTTNRTHLRDYARALDAHPDAALILRVHTSNFRVLGFTAEVPTPELVWLGKERGVPVMDDLGSGSLIDLSKHGLPGEPRVQDSVAAGAALITFSGDKLLGGPQAGLIVGTKEHVDRVREHPLYRALRCDKLALAALEATLRAYRDPVRARQELPALRMITATADALEARARALALRLGPASLQVDVDVARGASKVGGGSYAVEELPTWVVRLAPRPGATGPAASADALAAALRASSPAVFVRIHEGRVLLDVRTLLDADEDRAVGDAVLAVARAT